MKIVQILYSGLGGHGSVAFSLVAESKGVWKNSMIFFGIEPLLEEYRCRCLADGIEHFYVGAREGRTWLSWRKLYNALKREKPDVILLHSVKTVLPCWLYAIRYGAKLIAVEHQPNDLKKSYEWLVSILLMFLARNVVFLTSEYRNEIKTKLGFLWREKKVKVIPNGIDTNLFSPDESAAQESEFRIGMAARFADLKRQDLLIEAIAILRNENAPLYWKLSLAGDGDSLERSKDKVKKLDATDLVKFEGYLGEEELVAWLRSLRIYVHATKGETLSTSILQAMAMGLPIVASDVAGVRNLISHQVNGLLVDATSTKELANSIRLLVSDPELAKSLGQQARVLAQTKYSQSTMFQQYVSVINR